MSIVDAISKAKKLSQQHRVKDGTAGDAGRTVTRERDIRESTAPSAPPLLVAEPLVATPVDVDIVTCRKNRLLIPGSEETLDREVESAFRMLRTRVLQRARSQGWTTVGITSASPDDGKTLNALNLALSLAKEKNQEIVLLDLDMRNPSVYGCLGTSAQAEIRDYFEGLVPAEQLFTSIGVENLILAGGTQHSDRSSELLSTAKFEQLIDYIKGATARPLIIIDLPPVLVTDDALVLAPRLDSILIVTSEGRTDREQLKQAVDVLSEFRIGGFVLNRSRQAVQGYYGYA